MMAPQAALAQTIEAQGQASDPAASAWVSANAGAGKTHVLKMRVLRLLLADVAPARILCLTYTKAAAAEMSTRVFDELAAWATASDTALDAALCDLTGASPNADQRARARRLFARAIETPGGLKIQTIHAFAERLLQRFPLEAGIPPGFEIADERARDMLLDDAVDAMLADAIGQSLGQLQDALNTIVAYADETRFQDILTSALSDPDWLALMSALQTQAAGSQPNQDPIDLYYRARFGMTDDATEADVTEAIALALSDATLADAVAVLSASSGKRDQDLAKALADIRTANDCEDRAARITSALLTAKLEPRSDAQFISKAVRESEPGLTDTLCRARDTVAGLSAKAAQIRTIAATRALLAVTGRVAERFAAAKAEAGVLDFDDLIARTAALLKSSEQARWVLYKLDGGLDHILVDEAQDTSAQQWTIISQLASEFFALEANAGDRPQRTVFAVGDEKQSIYSFQGAAPEQFARAGSHFAEAAAAANAPFMRVPLTLSFRTVPEILSAVDATFAQPASTPGVTTADGGVRHAAMRAADAGRFEVWPLEPQPEVTPSRAFDPLGDAAERSVVASLSARIADTIAHWLATGRQIRGSGRQVTPRDILILVRKRHPFAGPLMSALKQRGLPVAGADRMVLAEHLAVQDLIALAEFLILPEDDLALANALKSPLFDFDDDDLIALAPGRGGSLWHALIKAAPRNEKWRATADALRSLRARADFEPPYEFFAALLDSDSLPDPAATVRQRMLRRLGPDATDPLDEFLQRALTFDDEAPPSMQGFIESVKFADDQIKRDMDQGRNEIRLMTAHGAKGLEAPIVILPDTMGDPTKARQDPVAFLQPKEADSDEPALGIWAIPAAKKPKQVDEARDDEKRLAREEADRLLYVAMTRARDELYVCGVAPKTGASSKAQTWYTRIAEATAELTAAVENDVGLTVQRLEGEPATEAVPSEGDLARPTLDPASTERPAWASTAAPDEPLRTVPLAPSRLAPLEVDETGDPLPEAARDKPATAVADPPSPAPRDRADNRRFLRGLVTHALLQHLPGLPAETWAQAATAFVADHARELAAQQRESIVAETLAVLGEPSFAPVFASGSRAEVSMVAEIVPPGPGLTPLRINGQIDRLAVTDHDVLIVDFKTNRPPPTQEQDVADAYLLQLAAYRLALATIYPGRKIRAALLWTDGPRLMEINASRLDAAEQRLWTANPPSLDLD